MLEDNKVVRRTLALTLLFLLAALALGASEAAAHNPACVQTGHADGHHYEKDTASNIAFLHNPDPPERRQPG